MIWLLGTLVLAGMLSLLFVHFRLSGAELARHADLVELLGRAGHFSRTIHEVQRERGLSSSYLTGHEERLFADLQAQYAATDFKLRNLGAALPEHVNEFATLDAQRRQVVARELSQREANEYYTARIASMLDGVVQLSLAAGGYPMQPDLIAHAHLIQAKEFLGQSRSTLLAMPENGAADPSWIAALGRHVGLYDWHVSQYLREANEDLASTMRGALGEQDMLNARRILDEATTVKMPPSTPATRREWYEAMTSAIDLLREMERYSLAGLLEKAEAVQAEARLTVMLQRIGLLLLSTLLIFLALTSLRRLLKALEAALRGARRAALGRDDAAPFPVAQASDEVSEISRGYGDLLELVDQLNLKATTDALTGALNRYGFAEVAGGELLRARRYHRDLTMIVFDLDRFKAINDRHGHATGDRVLQEVARLVRDNLRLADVFARWGGEEFVILAPETSGDEAQRLAEKLRLLFSQHRRELLPHFSASFGLADCVPEDDVASLFSRADRALYQAKQGGRDRVVRYQAGKSAGREAPRRIAVVSDNTWNRA